MTNQPVKCFRTGIVTTSQLILGVVACLLAPALWADAPDLAAGKSSYVICATCHGVNGEGNRALNAPRLAGQEAWYVDRQLALFRDGARGTAPGDTFGMQMRPMALAVSEPKTVANLIAYITSLPPAAASPTVEGDVAAGKTAYAVCAACHGQQAEGVEAMGGPRLAGLDDWYLVRQLENYRAGRRGYHSADTFGAQMKPMATILAGDEAVRDVVAYINTLD